MGATFSGNTSYGTGGGAYFMGNAKVTEVIFSQNTAYQGGGAFLGIGTA